jgi:hypothetical protein
LSLLERRIGRHDSAPVTIVSGPEQSGSVIAGRLSPQAKLSVPEARLTGILDGDCSQKVTACLNSADIFVLCKRFITLGKNLDIVF